MVLLSCQALWLACAWAHSPAMDVDNCNDSAKRGDNCNQSAKDVDNCSAIDVGNQGRDAPSMPERRQAILRVKAEACRILGDKASEWMTRPSRLLGGMAPVELAISPEGARVVLHELNQASTPFRTLSSKRRP